MQAGGRSTSRCWVRKTNKGRIRQPGLVSGNRACGVAGMLVLRCSEKIRIAKE